MMCKQLLFIMFSFILIQSCQSEKTNLVRYLKKPEILKFDWIVNDSGIVVNVYFKKKLEFDSLQIFNCIVLDNNVETCGADTGEIIFSNTNKIKLFFQRDYFAMSDRTYDSIKKCKLLYPIKLLWIHAQTISGKINLKKKSSELNNRSYFNLRAILKENNKYSYYDFNKRDSLSKYNLVYDPEGNVK